MSREDGQSNASIWDEGRDGTNQSSDRAGMEIASHVFGPLAETRNNKLTDE